MLFLMCLRTAPSSLLSMFSFIWVVLWPPPPYKHSIQVPGKHQWVSSSEQGQMNWWGTWAQGASVICTRWCRNPVLELGPEHSDCWVQPCTVAPCEWRGTKKWGWVRMQSACWKYEINVCREGKKQHKLCSAFSDPREWEHIQFLHPLKTCQLSGC